jgi:hypothetical protein
MTRPIEVTRSGSSARCSRPTSTSPISATPPGCAPPATTGSRSTSSPRESRRLLDALLGLKRIYLATFDYLKRVDE